MGTVKYFCVGQRKVKDKIFYNNKGAKLSAQGCNKDVASCAATKPRPVALWEDVAQYLEGNEK